MSDDETTDSVLTPLDFQIYPDWQNFGKRSYDQREAVRENANLTNADSTMMLWVEFEDESLREPLGTFTVDCSDPEQDEILINLQYEYG